MSDVKREPVPVSIDYGDQMRLFGELELMLTTVANDFLTIEKEEGRMSIESIQKVTKLWHNQNRPQVLEFRFDLAHQLLLVQANKSNFRFHGGGGGDPASAPTAQHDGMRVNVLLNGWRSVVRELGIRTFCTPDPDVRKLLHDSWRILEMLGAPKECFLLLQRLQTSTLAKMAQASKQREERKKMVFGVTKPYVPAQAAGGSFHDGDDGDTGNGIFMG